MSSDQGIDDMNVHRIPCNGDTPDLCRFQDAVLNNKVDVVKEMLDAGLDPNNIVPADLTEDKPCAGSTLLYVACVYEKMDIVETLLKAGADPDKGIRMQHLGKFEVSIKRSPFCYAVTMRNTELMRILLRESTVYTKVPFQQYHCLHYGLFRELCDDEDVMNVIMEMGSQDHYKTEWQASYYFNPANPCLATLLHVAAKYRSDKLFKHLMDNCGTQNAVDALLRLDTIIMNFGDYCVTDTLSHLIELHGARNFVEDDALGQLFMMSATGRMLQTLMNHFYQWYGDNKEWWKEKMIFKCTLFPDGRSFMHECMRGTISRFNTGESRFESVLRWGIYSVLNDVPHEYSVLYKLAQSWQVKNVQVFISLYPQCLQESWLTTIRKGDEPWHIRNTKFTRPRKIYFQRDVMAIESYFASLVEKKRHVPRLQVLCRSVIFHELGINPISKAEKLPLPRILKDFVQCKELFEANE